MLNLPHVPMDWQTILTAASIDTNLDVPKYIGGGALRDLILGLTPKDVDIFVGPGWNQAALESYGEVVEIDPAKSAAEDEWYSEGVVGVFELHWLGTKYQIIERAENPHVRQMVEQFDFGICRIAWDLSGWVIHNDFIKDLSVKQFKVRGTQTPAATLLRAKKFRTRFPGWTFDVAAADEALGVLLAQESAGSSEDFF